MSSGPQDISPREAAERWLSKQSIDKTENTLATYWYRIKKLVDYCEEHDIDRLADLTPWALDEFDAEFRSREPKKVTISKEYRTMQNWLAWAAGVGIVQEGLAEILDPPRTTKSEEVSTERLAPEVATANIRALRHEPVGGDRATIHHTLLELMWFSGARIGALRGLDRGDVDLDEGTLTFIHRPETGTPIKQAFNPERKIGLPAGAIDVLADYVDHCRERGAFDDHGREPFLTTVYGRAAETTCRRYSYFATVPCRGADCPHGQVPDECDWFRLKGARDCPSSRGPHAVRTGAITNLRNSGWSLDAVAERVNTSPERIKMHYDFPSLDEQYRERRSSLVDRLGLDTTDDTQTNDDH